MAINTAQFSKVANLNPVSSTTESRQLFHLEAVADKIATVKAAGYFNSVRELLNPGDRIVVVCDSGKSVHQLSVVAVPATGNVTTLVLDQGLGAGGLRVAAGIHETVDENDTVVTGLNTVTGVVAQLVSDPVDGCMHATADIGDQAGAPAAGSILIKTWKSTDADASLVAASTFTKKVSWIAFGT